MHVLEFNENEGVIVGMLIKKMNGEQNIARISISNERIEKIGNDITEGLDLLNKYLQ